MGVRRFFLLKVESSNKIPSYLQVRDESFSLLYYIRLDREEKIFQQLGIHHPKDRRALKELLEQTPYGRIVCYEQKEAAS